MDLMKREGGESSLGAFFAISFHNMLGTLITKVFVLDFSIPKFL
jgi:hypothetical protein